MGTQLSALIGLALRQLWISFRLLPLLALPLIGGLATAALAAASDAPLRPLGVGLAVGIALCAGLAADALSRERQRGTAAWLAMRSVPRSTIVLGWFAAIATPVMVGIAASALLAWIAVATSPAAGDLAARPLAYVALAAASATAGLQAVGIGLAAGSLARPWLAMALAVAAMALVQAGGFAVSDWEAYVPAGGVWLLARADALARPLSEGVVTLGVGLAVTGLLVALAAAVFSRGDL